MNIKDKLTIVIPSYNEEKHIERTVLSIVEQYGIQGTRVIIADGFSKDKTRVKIINLREMFKDTIKIELVNGGKVSFARNFGATLVKTKYVLFLDADSVLLENNNIANNIQMMEKNHLNLVTCKIKSVGKDIRTNIAFRIFNLINRYISIKTPFAVGTYFLTSTELFRKLKGFDESLKHSEDYFLSKKYNPRRFKISKHYVGQDDRRFKKMGYIGMIKLLVKGYINRDDINFFKKDVNYWQ
jgi:glycosyltransferase involved in cell wall biosynthesis